MKALDFIYQDTQIHFLLGNDKNVMVNATEMAKAFGKRLEDFRRLEGTKNFIKELLIFENEKLVHADVREQEVLFLTEKDIVNATNKGTYFHRILALKFAAWIDSQFELWIYSKIEEIKFQHYDAHLEALNLEKQEQARCKSLITQAYSGRNELAISIVQSMEKIKKLGNAQRSALGKQNRQISKDWGDLFELPE